MAIHSTKHVKMSEINQNSNEETKSDEHPPANETLQSVEDWSTVSFFKQKADCIYRF